MNPVDLIKQQLTEAQQTLTQFLNDAERLQLVEQAAEVMVHSLKNGGKILSCGNGGSFCDAQHFAEELTGRYRNNRNPIAAISISDASHITCVANDYGFNEVFSRYVKALGNSADTLLAISTSGNSENVINAAKIAKEKGMKVISLTGKNGGELHKLSDIDINVPYFGYADRIQEMHIKIIHILILLIEKQLAP
jgi:D-sedoheptulose 7-phosphate isomerase